MKKIKVKIRGICRGLTTNEEVIEISVPENASPEQIKEAARKSAYLDSVTELTVVS